MLKTNKQILIFIFIITLFLCSKNVYAASASISASKTDANVGDGITITTTIKGAAWQISLNGAVSENYADNTDNAEDTTITKKVTFKPTKADTYVVKLSGNVTGSNDTASTPVSGSVKINVKAKEEQPSTPTVNTNTSDNKAEDNQNKSENTNNETNNNHSNSDVPADTKSVETKKSDNANLSDLGIKPNDFRGFKPGNTSYDVIVPNDIEKVEIYAKTQDANARATGGGNKKLSVGDNSFDITVTAEDGETKKIYTINIKREEDNSNKNEATDNETVENTANEVTNQTANEISQETVIKEQKGDLKQITIPGYILSPLFNPNVYEYKLSVSSDVTELEVNAEPENNNVQIEIAGNKELKEGENVITIMCHNKETNKNTTYQIIAEKKAKENPHQEAINEAYKKRSLIIKLGVGLIIILIIACIIVFKKEKEDHEEDIDKIIDNSKTQKEAKKERNIIENEEKPLALQKKNMEIKENVIKKEKTQRQREEEFDEKLQKIKSEKRKEQRGGKHF